MYLKQHLQKQDEPLEKLDRVGTNLIQEQEIYRITDIKGILKQIDFTKTRNLQNWKKEMDNALYALNQEKYSTLVSLID